MQTHSNIFLSSPNHVVSTSFDALASVGPCVTFKGNPIPNAVRVFEDSFYVPGFVQTSLNLDPTELYRRINESAPWTDPKDDNFRYRGNELRRQKAFWVRAPADPASTSKSMDIDAAPSELRRYGYPGFQYGSMESYRPFERTPDVLWIANQLEEHLSYQSFNGPVEKSTLRATLINHVIGTRYRGADDNIGYHSDKIRDITPNTPIISISLGETRELHLGRPHEESFVDKDGKTISKKSTIFEQAFVLRPGDVFVLGPKTNLLHQHAIVPTSEERIIERDPNAVIGPRISLVLRDIATTISLAKVREKARATRETRKAKEAAKQMAGAVSKRNRDSKEESDDEPKTNKKVK